MAKIKNNFRFVGKLHFKDDGTRIITSKKNENWRGKEIELKVSTDTGTQYVKLFGGVTEGKPIYTFSQEKDEKGKLIKLEIPYKKRKDDDVIKTVANFKKIKILGKEFISEIDAIDYLNDNSIDFNGNRYVIYGDTEIDVYKGKVYIKYYLTAIYEAKEEDKDGFKGSMAFYINENSISEDYKKGKSLNYKLIEKDRKLPITVWLEQYNKDKSTRKDKPYLYIPYTVFLSLRDEFDFENENHVKKLKFKAESFLVKKGVHEIGWQVRYFKGAEKTEVTLDDLTNFEKAQIENEVKTLEEIAKGKQGYGEFKDEIQIIKPHGAYENGLIEVPLTEDDFEDLFFEEESKEEVKKEVEVETIEDDDDLF